MAAAAAATTTFLPPLPTPRPRLAATVRRPPPIFTGAANAVPLPEDEDSSDDDDGDAAAPRRSARKDRRRAVRIAWEKLVRWSRSWRRRNRSDVLETTRKVVVLGGGSFGTAMAAHVAAKKADLEVSMLLRDDLVCRSINNSHINCKYLPEHRLPENIVATTSAADALAGADFCFHAVPIQFSSSFLEGISTHVDPKLPFISLSKGLELNTLRTMSKIIPRALGNRRQPFIVLSGPSFAVELMSKLPTAMVVASKDKKLASSVEQLLASPNLRISTSSDVTGVEIAGALKNVLNRPCLHINSFQIVVYDPIMWYKSALLYGAIEHRKKSEAGFVPQMVTVSRQFLFCNSKTGCFEDV
ncbi:hypothetical protein PAHAL_2G086500 [Panicum hallii]|uniref:Glycerol-3-phosphate dehydrogenase NAD-dependent N-terminal domain-containing protein n=1 Tax=Panicum hallii TaxID=206008 RepID=A0A2T8KNE9_9POAL|nr:glycerol-3-phosphate dehydrogenase [NAD(+)], chloroplastic-like isoform X2 [Panicum hallii]PVH63690.1 hypothetical protein PAHAL_2G086500 [Panicum hallii]